MKAMEQMSFVVTTEKYSDFWEEGTYFCARCDHALYSSEAKFQGPCMWPSFRGVATQSSVHTLIVPKGSYNE